MYRAPTFEKSALRYFLAHESHIPLSLCVMGGITCGLRILAILFNMVQRFWRETSPTPASSKMALLVRKGNIWLQMIIFSYFEVKTWSCLCRVPLYVQNVSHLLFFLTVLVSLFSFFEISIADKLSACILVILFLSSVVRDIFLPTMLSILHFNSEKYVWNNKKHN